MAVVLIRVVQAPPVLVWVFFIAFVISLGLTMYLRFRSGKWREFRVICLTPREDGAYLLFMKNYSRGNHHGSRLPHDRRLRFVTILILVSLALPGLPAMLFAGGAGEAGGSGAQTGTAPGNAENAATAEGVSAAAGDPAYEQGVDDGPVPEDASMAVFAGGCFWCMEEAYEAVPGVYEAVSGYAGGDVPDPSYRQVVGGGTGHYEVVRVFYNQDVLSYEDLLYIFWRNVDPLDGGGQFCDRGSSYLAAVFTRTEEQARLARESKEELVESGRFGSAIQVDVLELDVIEGDDNDGFWVAEEYHQDYYLKNPVQYRFYKSGCGRVRRLEQVWGEEAGAPSYTKDA